MPKPKTSHLFTKIEMGRYKDMHDVKSNIIHTISKVIESAQSGYATKGLPARTLSDTQAQSLTLTVVANRQNQLILQEQSSAKRIIIDKQSVEGLGEINLNKGDKLALLTSKGTSAEFYVQRSETNAKSNIKDLARLPPVLSKEWTNFAPQLMAKIKPDVWAQMQVKTNTVQSSQLMSALVELAQKNGQPILALKLSAQASFLAQNKNETTLNNAVTLRLLSNVNASNVLLDLPLSEELKTKLVDVQSIALKLNGQEASKLISSMKVLKTGGDQVLLSQKTVDALNRYLSDELKQANSQVATNLKSLLTSSTADTLKDGIVITANEQNIGKLGGNVKQQLQASLRSNDINFAKANAMLDTKLLINTQKNAQQILLSIIAKPTLVSLPNSVLAIQENVQSNNAIQSLTRDVADIEGIGVLAKDAQSQKESKAQIDVQKGALSTQNIAGNKSTDGLYTSLMQMLRKQGHSSKSALNLVSQLGSTISNDINQALPHAQEMGKSVTSLRNLLVNISAKAQGETQLFINKVIESLVPSPLSSDSAQKPGAVLNKSGNAELSTALLVDGKNSGKVNKSITSNEKLEASKTTTSNVVEPDQPLPIDLIKQEVTANLLANVNGNVSPIAPVGANSGLVNGLVSMLQASLYAKLLQQQPSLNQAILNSPKLANMLASINPTAISAAAKSDKTPPKTNVIKVLQDISKLDPRGNLIEELNKVISRHSLNKLVSAEATLQGQDSFYYHLPNLFSADHKDTEIMITREKKEQQTQDDKSIQTTWQLNMKLDIGKNGDVLAKIKLNDNNVNLNLYASNTDLKHKVMQYLPYLNKRLKSLGLSVEHSCFVGKIPSSLHKTDFQVVHAYV